MVSNDVHVIDIMRLSTDNRYVHNFKVVIYRKHAEKVMYEDLLHEDVGCRPFVTEFLNGFIARNNICIS